MYVCGVAFMVYFLSVCRGWCCRFSVPPLVPSPVQRSLGSPHRATSSRAYGARCTGMFMAARFHMRVHRCATQGFALRVQLFGLVMFMSHPFVVVLAGPSCFVSHGFTC